MSHQHHDALAKLFARNMSLNPATPPPEPQVQISTPKQEAVASDSETPKTVYTSMHYNHSRHIVPIRLNATPESTPERQLPLTDDEVLVLLRQNNIDPQFLYPSQVHLLRHAEPEQRFRLLELWSISPPSLATYDVSKQQQSWNTTSMQQEEDMARLRYDRTMAERNIGFGPIQEPPRSVSSGSETLQNADMSIGSGVFIPPERPASAPEGKTYAEPYMTSGYEMLAKREYDHQQYAPLQQSTRYNSATDPVYIGFSSVSKTEQENLENYALVQNDDMEL